jgi:heme/copper-type cytochrome/quinol oxidase subunit 2
MRLSIDAPRLAILLLAGCALALPGPAAHSAGRDGLFTEQDRRPVQRGFDVVIRKYAVEPARLEVNQDDLVKITLTSAAIAHSFTVDAYRIAKRVGSSSTVTFEFRADQPGRFPIYCNLRQDERCREIRGELVVHPR